MTRHALTSLANYSLFVARLVSGPPVEYSTVKVWSEGPYTGIAEGEIFFSAEIRLRMREELDFDEGLITSYGYEVSHGGERLYWYDDFPHPNDRTLASSFPHHKHVAPDIKHHRIPAPNMSFNRPNLQILIEEIKNLIKNQFNQ